MQSDDQKFLAGVRIELVAALQEMDFWLRIMQEHAGLIRNGLDISEERLFREAERFYLELSSLLAGAESLVYQQPAGQIMELIDESLRVVGRLRDFKRQLTALIRECRVMGILPADLLDHIRREADFFLGELHFVKGEPTPAKETIGIPDAGQRALTVPKLLIPELPGQVREIALVESLFWLRQNMEHADVLSLYFRPGVQELLLKATQSHAARLHDVYNEALEVNSRQGRGLAGLLREAERVVDDWHRFLQKLFIDLEQCRVPTGQINLWPTLDDHMDREAVYYLEVIQIVSGRIS